MSKTQIATGGISDDAVTSAKTVTGLSTTVDLWRQNTDTAISANTETFLTSNWEQADTDGAATIGTALSLIHISEPTRPY